MIKMASCRVGEELSRQAYVKSQESKLFRTSASSPTATTISAVTKNSTSKNKKEKSKKKIS
jgi:hypothetical protein